MGVGKEPEAAAGGAMSERWSVGLSAFGGVRTSIEGDEGRRGRRIFRVFHTAIRVLF